MTRSLSYRSLYIVSILVVFIVLALSLLLSLNFVDTDDAFLLPDLEIEETKTLNGIDFPSKVWVHRVNTVERAEILLGNFAGIEIDVIYDSTLDVFDVRHRDIPSIGLYLERYFEVLEKANRPFYWIDIKNLERQNELEQFQKLSKLAKKYDLMKRIIVESPTIKSLARFTDAGFITSYYLPHFELEAASTQEIQTWVRAVKASISGSRVHAVSADYKMYPLIEKYFNDADTFLWASLRFDNLEHREKVNEIVSVENVKVLLVRQPTAHHR